MAQEVKEVELMEKETQNQDRKSIFSLTYTQACIKIKKYEAVH